MRAISRERIGRQTAIMHSTQLCTVARRQPCNQAAEGTTGCT
jgi:hypothetical protein